MRFPNGVPEKKRRELAEAAARERGYEPPFTLDLQDHGTDRKSVDVIYIGSGAALTAAIHEIQRRNRQAG